MQKKTGTIEDWVIDQNIVRFEQQLRQETDPSERRVLTELLSLERARRAGDSRSDPES